MEIMRVPLSLGDRILEKIRIKNIEECSNPYINTKTDS